MTPLLTAEQLHVIYRAPGRVPVHAVRGVSFRIDAGESLGIVGESGCGKSSLAKTLIGIQPPSAGTLTFEGRAVGGFSSAEARGYRRAVQMIFQDAVGSLNPRMTVRQTLAEVLRVHRMRPEGRTAARIGELLELVGLPETVLDAYPREISGGQCQRVSFARCLALEPRLIIADEPVSALDVSVQARILNLVRELQARLNLSIILISHDLAVVRNSCDRVAVMYDGEFVETGIAADVLDAPRHSYTRTLLSAVPDVARALRQRRGITK
ncbi:MAG: ATP-binding cassette domain-containing protein [Verrucomicrobiota bacterium]|jgi:ABC-type glutathione transport system ATPase component|nr:ATP-binding cassette domain-containing protein [Verrucomicrobiota bacterium]